VLTPGRLPSTLQKLSFFKKLSFAAGLSQLHEKFLKLFDRLTTQGGFKKLFQDGRLVNGLNLLNQLIGESRKAFTKNFQQHLLRRFESPIQETRLSTFLKGLLARAGFHPVKI
jgi:hypothetical protein